MTDSTVTAALQAARVLVAQLSLRIDDLTNALIDADVTGGDEEAYREYAQDAHGYLTEALDSLEHAVKHGVG